MKNTIVSKRFSLNYVGDFIRGLGLGVGIPLLTGVQELIPGWDIHILYKIAISSFIAYIIKNFALEPPKVITTATTNAEAVDIKETFENKVDVVR